MKNFQIKSSDLERHTHTNAPHYIAPHGDWERPNNLRK